MHVVSNLWFESDTSGTFSLSFDQSSLKLEKLALRIYILWCRTDSYNRKLSVKVSLMLHSPFSSSIRL